MTLAELRRAVLSARKHLDRIEDEPAPDSLPAEIARLIDDARRDLRTAEAKLAIWLES